MLKGWGLQRLSFSARLVAILTLVLFAAMVLGAGANFAARQRDRQQPQLPLPDQAAAIVALLDAASAEQRALLLRAANTDDLSISVVQGRPDFAQGRQRMPAVEWLVGQYLDVVGARDVIAAIDQPDNVMNLQIQPQLFRLWYYWLGSSSPLKLGIALKSGDYVVFETRKPLGMQLFGMPVGFVAGAFGALIAVLAVIAVMREARPLTGLAAALERFSESATPVPIEPKGAPEIRSLIQATNAMQSRIAVLLKGRTVLLGAISHDLKTYLTRLRLRIESIDDAVARDKASADIDDMTLLIDEALAVAKGGEAKPPKGEADLAAIIRRDAEIRPPSRITISVPHDQPCLVQPADALALSRLVANLVDNALRYANLCTVTLIQDQRDWVLMVDDDGPGIPASERGSVFEPFHRLETSRNRATGGSGLGLAIAHQIVERHGGSITIDAAPAGGARLRVSLPSA
jgi:two-component system, OmpR family, osmolarity sensor histidine kinase EnvZ